MKKIKFPIQLNKKISFEIDPSIVLERDLREMIDIFKIKLISFQNEPEIIWNLYVVMDKYFSKEVKEDLIERTCDLDMRRHISLMKVLEEKKI